MAKQLHTRSFCQNPVIIIIIIIILDILNVK